MSVARYRLEPLSLTTPRGWDELLQTCPDAELFHRRPWLDFLAASCGADIRLWAILEAQETVGYFAGGIIRKGPFRVLGSPLKGWGTNYMGPISLGHLDVAAFLGAVDSLARTERLAMVELESRMLDTAAMATAGYQCVPGDTYVLSLTTDSRHLWEHLDSHARNRIRRALGAGLSVEEADTSQVAGTFYDQYCQVLKHKAVAPPYTRDRPRLLFEHLTPANQLFALCVRDTVGNVIATGLFPHDDRTMYFWGGASWRESRDLCPNDLLHWHAIRLAAAHKLVYYDMCGTGRFKRKFRGAHVSLARWHKFFLPGARWARGGYEALHEARRRVHAYALPRPRMLAPPRSSQTVRYVLEPLDDAAVACWDKSILSYDSRQLFHRRVWLDFLAKSQHLEPRFWVIRQGSRRIGYFCGGVLTKGPFRLLGSPMKGWTTNFMGPVVNKDFDQPAFLRALDDLAARERLAMIEIENPVLSATRMEEFGYKATAQPTYVTDLAPLDPNHLWSRIDIKSRQKVRKALRLGLTVEESFDPAVATEFYAQFVEVLARKRLYPPYGPDCPRLLIHLLSSHGLLLSLCVRAPNGDIVATGLFPHDDTTLYFWGGASRIAAWHLAPNDLLQWTAMQRAAGLGLRVYNMCGYGHFKSKFGGVLDTPYRWHKSYSRLAQFARHGYAFYFAKCLRLRSSWHSLRYGRQIPTSHGEH